ncbi:transglutaminase-like cysteine peptidase [uncultured Neptuniibacter sp.]|uniref:transglutaminase-like cysteine peptidase n=1 Tax=uncultured Neptuniibacter sp. TaxID=502143 RepID=UPI00260E4B62|nr:transglutaminase-like cysteine peptidase [uncultured Neptuniibacter sp.]
MLAHRHPEKKTASRCSLILLTCLFVFSSFLLIHVDAESIRLSKADIEKLGKKYGERAKLRIQSWQNLLTSLADQDETTKLKEINNFFNQVRFIDDIRHWKKKDYWATPVEFLITNGGDCEDFSIAKYYTLKELGVAVEKMNLAYVKALDYNQAHMVLTYYPNPRSTPLVLDNINGEILPASKRPDLLHVYSFNGDKLWLSKMGRRTTLVGTSDRLKPWVKLQSRIENKDINLK